MNQILSIAGEEGAPERNPPRHHDGEGVIKQTTGNYQLENSVGTWESLSSALHAR